MRLRVALCLLVTGAALISGCGGQSPRDRVARYVGQSNAILDRATPDFQRAENAYVAFEKGKLGSGRVPAALMTAERSIRAIRARLAAIVPPPVADGLRQRLLRVFDLNASMAHETIVLASYLPAATAALNRLPAISRRLNRDLRASAGSAAQQQALARYAAQLGGVLTNFRRLKAPAVLAPGYRTEVARLRTTRSLAVALGGAIAHNDAKQIARLLLRFRSVDSAQGGGVAASAVSLATYNGRIVAILAATADVRREESRLQRQLG